ncbi:thioredoxin superfamily protein [Wolffia australiana]
MPLTTIDASVANFAAMFDRFKADRSRKKFLLFLADKDPVSNLSWCPDCNVAEPVIYKKLEATAEEVVMLRAFVGDRPTWRSAGHPFREDPVLKIKGVPTLILWDNDAIAGRLEDYEAHRPGKIDALLV